MSLTFLDAILDAQGSQERPKRLPKTAQNEPKTPKNRSLKISRFQRGFVDGLDMIFSGFLDNLLNPKIAKFAKIHFYENLKNSGFP